MLCLILSKREVLSMNQKELKGIALILFGILLCLGSGELNHTILRSFSDFPFAVLGVLIGIFGLYIIFRKEKQDK